MILAVFSPFIPAATTAETRPYLERANNLSTCVINLGMANHIQIVFEPQVVKGLACQAKHDHGSLEDRLNSLLSPYGLAYRRAATDLIVIYTPTPVSVPALPEPEPVSVIVRSYRQSLIRASDAKRRAEFTLDAIDAEDIGKYPARNVAEALQLVTGVSLERQRGIGLYISVRGMGPQFQNIEFDGHTLATTELIENAGVRGRDFRFDILSADLVRRIDVIKTPTPDMEEGALGGNINIHTLRPFDLVPMGHIFKGLISVKISHNDRARDASPAFQLMSAWATRDRRFGAVVSLISEDQRVRNDRFYNYGWNLDQFSNVLGPGLYTPTRTRPTIELESRTHKTLFAAAQMRPDDHNDTEVSLLATRLDVAYDEMGLDIYPDDSSLAVPAFVPGTVKVTGDTAISGQIQNVRFMASRETSLNRFDLLLGHITHHWHQAQWTANISLDVSKAHSFHPFGQGTTRSRVAFFAPLTYDFSGTGQRIPSLKTTIDYTDPKVFTGQRFDYATKDARDSDESVSYDISRAFAGPLLKVQVGQQYLHHNRSYQRQDWKIYDLAGLDYAALGPDSFDRNLSPTFLKNIPGDTPRQWVIPSATAFFDRLMTPERLAAAPTATDLAGSFQIDERIVATFIRSDWGFQVSETPVTANVGVRQVDTKQVSQGAALVGTSSVPVQYRFRYATTLPSANLRAELTPTLILRLSAARIMARPNVIDSAPRLTISNDADTGQGGNPYLRPYLATDFSSGLEWYGPASYSLSAALFRRHFDQYVTRENSNIFVPGRGNILISTTINGGKAEVQGFEAAYNQTLDFLPGALSHLGVQLSLTALAVKADYNSGTLRIHNELTGLSHSSYNLVGYYEDDSRMLRIGYYWRGKYLSSVGSSVQSAAYTGSFGSLDGSVSLKLDTRTTLNLEGVNLLDAKRYVFAMTTDRVQEIHQYGRTFNIQLRRSF